VIWLAANVTPIYNLGTHDMGKIVKVFDPTTGQVTKMSKVN